MATPRSRLEDIGQGGVREERDSKLFSTCTVCKFHETGEFFVFDAKTAFVRSADKLVSTFASRDIYWVPTIEFPEYLITIAITNPSPCCCPQVNGWGFKRITEGPDHNAYFHEVIHSLCIER